MSEAASLPIIGLDIAKNVFQVHQVDSETGEIRRRQIRRAKVVEFFSKLAPSLVAMEACGGAHHWARVLIRLGHKVKLLPAQHVKAFLLRDKTDALDAQAIWIAAQQKHLKEVAVKSELQQACLTLHSMRQQLMKVRIMQTNALRGLLYEFGIALPVGHARLPVAAREEISRAQLDGRLPEVVVLSMQEQLKRIDLIQEDIDQLGRRLAEVLRQNQQMLAIAEIPGIGPLTATALVASVGDISMFKTARQFASWLGLTPRQTGTGGKTQQHGISKRGDSYVRTLLVAGARAVIARSARSSWIDRLLQRRHINVVVVALANKMARAAWAVLTKGHAFDPCRWSPVDPSTV